MIFRQLFDGTSFTYTYLVADPKSKKAVLIDPVYERHSRDSALVRELDLELLYTLDTHVHADHVTGAWLMKRAFGSRIGIAKNAGVSNVDVPLEHDQDIAFGELSLEVRATPGHTSGCLSFVSADQAMVFTGDALLIRGAGRTDFQGGDPRTLYRSIMEQIFSLPDGCLIYPGHDYQGRTVSTVLEERRFNPRLGGAADENDFVGYMSNLRLPHPKQIDLALPANMRAGEPKDGVVPGPASWGPAMVTYGGIVQIDPEWVAQNRGRIQLVDVRTEHEIDEELPVLEGSHMIPLDELRSRMDEVAKDRPVVTVCRSGKRSGLAMLILAEAGLTAANLAGGIIRWRQLSLPVNR